MLSIGKAIAIGKISGKLIFQIAQYFFLDRTLNGKIVMIILLTKIQVININFLGFGRDRIPLEIDEPIA